MTIPEPMTIIITGGTIDSVWDGTRDTAVPAQESILPEYFKKLNLGIELNFKTVCMKDSRELTQDDIKQICQAVDDAKDSKILVTHGTYTMPDTARYLQHNMKTQKAVVLMGSMVPLRGYDMSDAPFNLGFAISVLQQMEGGVRLVMQGNVFKPDEVAKNLSEGKFFSIEQ